MNLAERTNLFGALQAASARSRTVAWIWPRARLVAESVLFVLLPAAAPFLLLQYLLGKYQSHPITVDGTYFPDGGYLFDLHVMWKAGHDVVLGHSPYPFVYPAPAALFMAPFGLLPFKVAAVVFTIVLLGAAFLTLRMLGVTDWRCYGVAIGTMAGTAALTTGSLTWLLALCAALAWRYRDRRLVVASVIVFAVVTKIFLWPLVIWLIATRRVRTALFSIGLGILVVLGSWAVIGFDGFLEYPKHLGHVAGLETARSYSPFALVQSLGGSTHDARLVVAALTCLSVAVIWRLGRGQDGDRRAFVAAIAASLLLSPIVWAHYFVLLFVVLALYRPRLSAAWLVPLGLWILPGQDSHGSTGAILTAYALLAAAAGLAMYRTSRHGVRSAPLEPA